MTPIPMLDRGAPRPAPSGCASSRATVKPIDEMIRFVVGPDRAVVPDLKRKLPGRGVWVTARRDIAGGGGQARRLRARVSAPT